MPYTISNLKDDLEPKLHGTSLAKVNGVYNRIYEAARNMLSAIDPLETRRTANIESALYDDVFRYTVPTDLKLNKILDIRPQVNRTVADNFNQTYGTEFGLRHNNNSFNVEFDSGTKFINIAKQLTAGTLLHDMNSITANGTWAASSEAGSLAVDDFNYLTGNASLKFNLTYSAGSGYLENSTFTAVDLTDMEDTGALFLWVYMPTGSAFTNVNLRWGDSTSNYWAKTVTTAHDSTTFRNGWNLLRFDWSSATETGTPTVTSVNYARITFTFTSTQSAVRVDNLISRAGEIYEMVYYSEFLFTDTTGATYKQIPTLDTDIIRLSDSAYNILLYELGLLVTQEIQGEDGAMDKKFFKEGLFGDGRDPGLYANYKAQYKSEFKKPRQDYYRMGKRGR